MKNSNLSAKYSLLKKLDNIDMVVLSSSEERSILGGRIDGCPMLTTCVTYIDCPEKFKSGGQGQGQGQTEIKFKI